MTKLNIEDSKMISALDEFIDHTLNKVNGVNKPFKAIQKTDEYKKFESMFSDGILDQSKWLSDNVDELFNSAGIQDDLTPLALDQQQKIKGQIQRDMPTLSSYVSQQKVFELLRDFFEFSAVQQYKRWGQLAKVDGTLDFALTNEQYIKTLQDRAAYLLNKSSLDETTIEQIIAIITQARLDGMTNAEVATLIGDKFETISSYRADTITRTESANSMGMANHATARENGASTKRWIAAGEGKDEICAGNEDQGYIGIDDAFQSGVMYEPGHPNCECYTEAGLIDLDSIVLWDGS